MIDCVGEASPNLPIPIWMIYFDLAGRLWMPFGIGQAEATMKYGNLEEQRKAYYDYNREFSRGPSVPVQFLRYLSHVPEYTVADE